MSERSTFESNQSPADTQMQPSSEQFYPPTDLTPEAYRGQLPTHQPETQLEAPKKSKRGLAIGLSAGGAAIALVVGLGLGIGLGNKNESAPDSNGPVPTDTNSSTGETGEGEVDAPSVDAEKLMRPDVEPIESGLDHTEFSKRLIDGAMTDWRNAGASIETIDAQYESGEEWEEYTAKMEADNRESFADALLVSDWRSDANLVKFADDQTVLNKATLDWYLLTWADQQAGDDSELFEAKISLDSSKEISNDGDTRTISMTFTGSGNGDKNRVGMDGFAKPNQVKYVVTTKVEDGHEKISNWRKAEI